MQNRTGRKSAQIGGIPAQMPRVEKPVTYFTFEPLSFWSLALLWMYAEWEWMKIHINLGIPHTTAKAGESTYSF